MGRTNEGRSWIHDLLIGFIWAAVFFGLDKAGLFEWMLEKLPGLSDYTIDVKIPVVYAALAVFILVVSWRMRKQLVSFLLKPKAGSRIRFIDNNPDDFTLVRADGDHLLYSRREWVTVTDPSQTPQGEKALNLNRAVDGVVFFSSITFDIYTEAEYVRVGIALYPTGSSYVTPETRRLAIKGGCVLLHISKDEHRTDIKGSLYRPAHENFHYRGDAQDSWTKQPVKFNCWIGGNRIRLRVGNEGFPVDKELPAPLPANYRENAVLLVWGDGRSSRVTIQNIEVRVDKRPDL